MRLLQGNRLLSELGSARQLDDHNVIEHEAPGQGALGFPSFCSRRRRCDATAATAARRARRPRAREG